MDNLTFVGLLFIPVVLLSFIITLLITPNWIRKAKKLGIVWEDVHKWKSKEKVAGSGGLAVLIGFIISVLSYVAIKTFIFKSELNTVNILIVLITIILAALIGFIDDIFGWKSGGLSKRTRLLMMFFIAIPLMVVNAGESIVMGVDLGLLYPLLLIPIAIIGTGTTFNFLAGYNGLEASQGILVLTALAIVTYITGNPWLSLVTMCMVAALFAFYLFNKYPAKAFPGDILTYPVGALIGVIAIMGNNEKIALFFFIPYILEVILKARGKFEIQSFSKVNKKEELSDKYGKVYGLEHLAVRFLNKIKGKAYEWEVPLVINAFQLIFIVLGFLLFF